jgi:lantibiotic modifying enzyme
LASLAAVTGRQDFADVALECIRFERSNAERTLELQSDRATHESRWRSQWCHGSVGIGLALIGITRRNPALISDSATAVDDALDGAMRDWPGHVDTLCCGSLGSVELLREVGKAPARGDLSDAASRRLEAVMVNRAATGDYRWNGGARRFNVGLFRGLAGVGYTCLREVDKSLPNLLIWE